MRIGFVGTGSMGAPVARNLVRAGHDVRLFDSRPEAMASVAGAPGCADAVPCASAREASAGAEVVFLSLPSHVEVAEVCLGDDGLLASAAPGSYLIDLTTVSVALVPRLVEAASARGVHYLTSPVSQGVDNAEIGKLSLFVGGDAADVEACMPLYKTIGEVVIHTGDHVSAMAAKLLTNLLWFVNAAAIGEALLLGARAGIDLPVLQQVVLNSCGTSWVAEHDIPSIYDGSFDETFTTRLCTKDLGLIAELASGLGVPLEVGGVARASFQRAEERYGPDSPELSVVRYLQEQTGTGLQL
ncbi:NAD(P)-dependent oxidoreductase [Spongisporangium articulatum]|uniref:NAD(P)-dependent oxidoreductase n=1 Tax=Spongisporangium articulatum TaxID=3362603 RepID=A0ABW8ASW6_9ACTN